MCKTKERGIDMYCTSCGNKMSDGAKFCTKCGVSLEDEMSIKESVLSDSVSQEISDYSSQQQSENQAYMSPSAYSKVFVEPDEQLLGTLGNGYLENILHGKVKKCHALLTDKRVYLQGTFFSGSRKTLQQDICEKIVDVEDITGTGFRYSKPVSKLLQFWGMLGGIFGIWLCLEPLIFFMPIIFIPIIFIPIIFITIIRIIRKKMQHKNNVCKESVWHSVFVSISLILVIGYLIYWLLSRASWGFLDDGMGSIILGVVVGVDLVLLVVLLVQYIKSRKTYFVIEYAGGAIRFNATIVGLSHVKDFQKQIRRAKDKAKGKI